MRGLGQRRHGGPRIGLRGLLTLPRASPWVAVSGYGPLAPVWVGTSRGTHRGFVAGSDGGDVIRGGEARSRFSATDLHGGQACVCYFFYPSALPLSR
jgi:hypothetical protein